MFLDFKLYSHYNDLYDCQNEITCRIREEKEGNLFMAFFIDVIKGMFIGIANIIPGVSGGTMAVSLGIYDKLISSISRFFKDWKKSVRFLLPIVLGCGIGIVAFSYLIEYLLTSHTFVTCMAFVGLIIGGFPVLVGNLKQALKKQHKKLSFMNVLFFLVFFTLVVGLPMLKSSDNVLGTITASPITAVVLFFVGLIASATMVVPGVSGSLILMILGYYYGIINSLKSFFDALKIFDVGRMFQECLILVPFGIGVIAGIVIIAKLIEYLFEKHSIPTYSSILGLIAASPFAIFYNTGLIGQLPDLTLMKIVLGLLTCIVGIVVTYFLGEKKE